MSGTEIASEIVYDLISKIGDLPLSHEENTENIDLVSQIIDDLILNIEESSLACKEIETTENQEMISQIVDDLVFKSEESPLAFKEIENPGIRVKKWKENMVHNVTIGIAPENIPGFMKNVQEGLNMRNTEHLEHLTKEIQDMPKNQDLHKSVEFKDGNTKNVVVFYCSKDKKGTSTVAYAIHSISYQLENAESEIGEEYRKPVTYQKQEAERCLRELGFQVPNVPNSEPGSRPALPTQTTLLLDPTDLICENCGRCQDIDTNSSRTKPSPSPNSLAWVIYECICKFLCLPFCPKPFCTSEVNDTEHYCTYCKAPMEWKETPSEQSPLLITTE